MRQKDPVAHEHEPPHKKQKQEPPHPDWNQWDALKMCSRVMGRMITWLHAHQELSHKCSILFSNNTLLHLSSHFGFAWWLIGNSVAILSSFQSIFQACRGHQGWGHFTGSSVPLINCRPYIKIQKLRDSFSTGKCNECFACLQIFV